MAKDPNQFARSILDQIIAKHDPEAIAETGKDPKKVASGLASLESQRASVGSGIPIGTAIPVNGSPARQRIWALIQSIGLVAIGGIIFSLGVIYNTVTITRNDVDKINQAITSPSKDSLSSRMSAAEIKLENIQRTLDDINKKLDSRLPKK